MNKYEELFENIIEMIVYAEEDKHINYDQKEFLLDQINRIKIDLDNYEEESK